MNFKFKHIIFLIAVIFIVAIPVHAESATNVSLSLVPETPGAMENVTATLVSYSTDLDMSMITWSINGKNVLSGTGEKKMSFKTGAVGNTTKIIINIRTSEGEIITQTLNVTPSDLDVIWEAIDSYTPPFYRGKAMPAREANLKIVAVPNNQQANNSGTVYTWGRNFTTQGKMSGYGKNVFLFKNSFLNKSESISIEAKSTNGDYRAKKEIVISPILPKVVFYKKNLLGGIFYNKALSDRISMNNEEQTIVAEPYFFSSGKNPTGTSLSYNWKINNVKTMVPERKNQLTIKAPSQKGVARLELIIEDEKTLFQEASASLLVDLRQ